MLSKKIIHVVLFAVAALCLFTFLSHIWTLYTCEPTGICEYEHYKLYILLGLFLLVSAILGLRRTASPDR